MNRLRFWAVVVLLGAAALVLFRRGNSETIVSSEPLSDVPQTIAGLTEMDVPIEQEQLDILGKGDFLSRVYSNGGRNVPVGLFIAYFASQRTGTTVHSPKNCLPGSGWSFESSQVVTMKDVNGMPHQVGEYIIANGNNRQFVIYWYQAHGRSVASEYLAKAYLVSDAIRMNRTDGALVRVITPIHAETGVPAARERAEGFVAELMPQLPRFIPN
jgi:EpsI family protein